MNTSFLTKIILLLSREKKTIFDISIEEQSSFLESLGEPVDDLDRSFKQYQCQFFFEPRWKIILLNIIAFFACPFIICGLLFKAMLKRKSEHIEAVAVFRGVSEVIPQELYLKYDIKDDCSFDNYSLRLSDLKFICHIIPRHIIHPFFLFKSVLNIAKYSYLLDKYHPKCIIVHNEFTFSSSLLTCYCHFRDVKHIDVMHGEKLFNIRDSFFHYDTCFVWDEYYINLFLRLKAESTQFKIAIPSSLVIETDKFIDKSLYADYKYYLVNCSEDELKSIINSMSFVYKKGYTVKYRPHPRWTNISLLESLVSKDEIEYPNLVDIMQSISNTAYAVGSYTTVLNQAVNSGKGVVLDDVTYKSQYNKLKELKYILANRNFPTLSELQLDSSS